MLYNSIKIIHILSGTVVVTALVSCISSWWNKKPDYLKSMIIKTVLIIVPFVLIQLLSGFTLLSLHPEYLSQLWSKGSVIFFIVGLSAWFLFLGFLSSEKKNPRLEISSLVLCVCSVLMMLFLMANKI